MKITVRLFATFRENREKESTIETAPGTKVEDVVRTFNIPPEDVAIIMINGRGKTLKDVLSEGDVLALFPPVGGG